MIPLLAIPNIQTPPPILSEAFSGVPTQTTALARIPFNAVPSNVPASAAYNNNRNGFYYATGSAPPAGGSAQASPFPVTDAAGVRITQSGFFTSSFMAQMMGQGGAAQDGDVFAAFFTPLRAGGALTLDAELLERYSLTKYKPSEAFRPPETPQGAARLVRVPEPPPAPAERAVPTPTADMLRVPTVSTPPAAATAAAPAAAETPRSDRAQRPQIRTDQSLIRPRGVDAYNATFVRNLLNLGSAPEQPLRLAL